MEMVLELDLREMSKESREVGTRSFPRERVKQFRDILEYF